MSDPRRPVIAANWKMHKTVAEAAHFVDVLLPRIAATQSDVVLCPPFTALAEVVASERAPACTIPPAVPPPSLARPSPHRAALLSLLRNASPIGLKDQPPFAMIAQLGVAGDGGCRLLGVDPVLRRDSEHAQHVRVLRLVVQVEVSHLLVLHHARLVAVGGGPGLNFHGTLL